MNGVLFLSQKQLDQWLEAGQVDMGAETVIFTSDRQELPMVPAVKFDKVVAGADQYKLLGKVKSVEAMRMGGAEVTAGAVVMADAAYEVEDGFLLTVELPDRPAAPPTSKPGAKPAGKEADLLAQFILDKLS